MSRFFCLWIPHFEAWALACHASENLHEQLALFAVTNRGRIIAASPSAQEKGIQIGFTPAKAQALAPALQLVQHYLPITQMVWEEVLRCLYEFTPQIEPLHAGLLLADVHPPSLLAPLLRQWQAHGGLADDRTTAELAAYTAGLGKLRSVRAGCSAAFLRRVPLTVFSEMSVPVETIRRLNWFGWQNVAQLSALTKRQLTSQFERGELLYRYAQATDTKPVATFRPSPQLHTRISFEEPLHEFYEIEPALPLMVERLQERLNGRLAQTITVVVEAHGTELKQQHILRDATASARTLCRVAGELLRQLFQVHRPVQRLEVILGGLTQPAIQQGTLFGPTRPSVVEAVRAVERRFPSALGHFVVMDPEAYLPEHFALLQPLAEKDLQASTKRVTSTQKSAQRNQKRSQRTGKGTDKRNQQSDAVQNHHRSHRSTKSNSPHTATAAQESVPSTATPSHSPSTAVPS